MITKLFINEIQIIDNKIYDLIDKIEHPIVKEETKRLITTGGKRLRPLFLIWSSSFSKGNTDAAYTAAASLELLHTSSLIHDDIIDGSLYRRGAETTLNIFGRERAASIGTVLTMFSIGQIISLENKDISVNLASTLENLCLGELKQLDERYNFNCSQKDYFEKISHKTASLFALPCKMGGIIGGLEESQVKKLYEIGYNIGCSFQILDDLMDITSNLEITGKECNQDIKSGTITLPYLLLMEKDPAFREDIKALTPNSTSYEFDSILEKVRASSSIEESYRCSNSFLDKARSLVQELTSRESRGNFTYIIDYLYK